MRIWILFLDVLKIRGVKFYNKYFVKDYLIVYGNKWGIMILIGKC